MLKESSRSDINKLNRSQAIGAALGTLALTLGIFSALLLMNIASAVPGITNSKIIELAFIIIGVIIAIFCFGTPAVKLHRYQKTHRKLSTVYPKKEALSKRNHYAKNTAIILALIIFDIIAALLISRIALKQYNVFTTYTIMITPIIALAPLLSYNGTRLGDYSDALKAHQNPKNDHKNQDRFAAIICLIALVFFILFTIFNVVF